MSNHNDDAKGSNTNVVQVDPEGNSILDSKLQVLVETEDKSIQLEKKRDAFLEGEVKSPDKLLKPPHKRKKLREIDHRHSQPELALLQPLETVQGEQVRYQWTSTEIHHTEQNTESAEYQQVEPIRIESQWTELQQAQTKWVELQKVEVEPQWSDYSLIPPQATPVLLTPVETAQTQYAEIQEITEIRVVKKIRIYKEVTEELEHN